MLDELFPIFDLIIPDLAFIIFGICINIIQVKIVMNDRCRKVSIIAGSVNGNTVPCPQIKIKKDAEDKDKDKSDRPDAVFVIAFQYVLSFYIDT